MRLAELIEQTRPVEPGSAADAARRERLLAQLELRGVSPPQLGRALHPSLRRTSVGPAALDAYYVSRWLGLYARSGCANYARDAALHCLLQQAGCRVWPWGAHEPCALAVQVGGLEDAGPLALAADAERVPRVWVPWSAAQAERAARRWDELAQACDPAQRARAAQVRRSPLPLAQTPLAVPIGVLLLALEDAEAARELLAGCAARLAPELDLALYGEPAVVEAALARLELGACERQRALTRVSSLAGEERPELLVVLQRRAPGRPRRAAAALPVHRRWDRARRADHVVEFAPARALQNRRPERLLGRDPLDPADRALFAEHPYLLAQSAEQPAARYAVLHGAWVDAHGRVLDRAGRWLEDTSPPYAREAIRRRGAESPALAELELAGSWSVVPAAGLAHTHWLVEGLLRLWPLAALGEPVRLLLPQPLRAYQRRLLELAGWGPGDQLELAAGCRYRCERLVTWLFTVGHSRELADFLGRLRESVPRGGAPGPERIFVPRGDAGPYRVCVNEELLEQGLRARGFAVVTPSALGADDEIRIFRAARVIVGPLGAGLYNCAFSRPGALIVAYGARSYMEPHLHQLAQLLAHRVHYAACEEFASEDVDPECGTRNSSYFADVPELLGAVDAALAGAAPEPAAASSASAWRSVQ